MKLIRIACASLFLAMFTLTIPPSACAEKPVSLKFSKPLIESKWHHRISSFLDSGVVPLIDLLSFLNGNNGQRVIDRTIDVMDSEGVALISFAGYWAPGTTSRKFEWSYYIHEIVNKYPDRFILTTNKGSNKNWWKQKTGSQKHFLDQLERHVRSGEYPFMGQIEFRHYMSNAQCKQGKTHRDVDIPLDGPTGHRIFSLAAETGVPFALHLEPENTALDALEEMLGKYSDSRVIVSHFGQIRHPENQKRFGAELVERLLKTYPNLYFDISTGEPGRYYQCGDHKVLDTVLWKKGKRGKQIDTLKDEYKKIFTKFSSRFIVGFDFGPANRQSDSYLRARISNVRLIMRDLPEEARHNISYRNAWYLLTGRRWTSSAVKVPSLVLNSFEFVGKI